MSIFFYVDIVNPKEDRDNNYKPLIVGKLINQYSRVLTIDNLGTYARGLPIDNNSKCFPIFCEIEDYKDTMCTECITQKRFLLSDSSYIKQSPNLHFKRIKEVEPSVIASKLRQLSRQEVSVYCSYLKKLEDSIREGYALDIQNKQNSERTTQQDIGFIKSFYKKINKKKHL